MPEHVCGWNLAPGLDNAVAWRRAMTVGLGQIGRIATLPGPGTAPSYPSPTVATDHRRREWPWQPQFYGSSADEQCLGSSRRGARSRTQSGPRQLRSQLGQLPARLPLHRGVTWQTYPTARPRDRSPRLVA
jgi:hypothetical protein